MFAAGLVDEVKQLLAGHCDTSQNNSLSRTASQAVGYKEVLDFLNGQRDLAATIELVKVRTRQFAKRQLTWFRSLSECRWIQVQPPLQPVALAQHIAMIGAKLT